MTNEPTNAEKIRRLPWSILANATNAVYVYLTFFGSVFVLFLSELGLTKTEIGSLLSLLPFAGLIALFIAPAVARYGYKRTYLTFFGGRKVITIFLLFTPMVLARYGTPAATRYVVGVVAVFAVCRAVSITALYPWVQEYVPTSVRGKYSAVDLVFWSLTSFMAVSLGGYVLGADPDLRDFNILFAVGLLFGIISLIAATFIPGGAPRQDGEAERTPHQEMAAALRDKNFVRHAVGVGLTLLATGPVASFLPLFQRDEVGLLSGIVVWLQAATLLGGLAASYVWGWAADRYGSKPIMSSGAYLLSVLPLLWWVMPRQSPASLYIALGIAAFQGIASLGWQIGSGRMLYVGVVPPEKKAGYMALYYAWIGIVGGIGQMFGGRLLDAFGGLSGQLLFLPIDAYSVLFAIAAILPLLNVVLLRGVHSEDTVGVAKFAGFFLRGNPFRAAESLIRYHWARDERAAVSVTERLGQSRSPLTVDELLEALEDPRFYVRFEAIVSIARGSSDPRLTEALVEILQSKEPALSVIAAWALGRMGDPAALPALREGINAEYRSIRAHSARSLGSMGDRAAIPDLLERLRSEQNEDLRVAFGSALGALEAQQATADLLDLLYTNQDEDARLELALALARLVGNEHHFIHLWRAMRTEPGTAASQAMTSARKSIEHIVEDPALGRAIEDCAEVLARQELEEGTACISRLIPQLPLRDAGDTVALILNECALRLEEFGVQRREYLQLALHAMNEGWRK